MWYVYGTFAAGAVLIVTVGALVFMQPSTPPPVRTATTNFDAPSNPFSILQRQEAAATTTTATSTSTPTITNDRLALQALHTAWQARHDALVETYLQAPPAPNTASSTSSADAQTPEALFSSLLGPRITNALRGTSSEAPSPYESTSFSGEAVLWNVSDIGSAPSPITPTATTYEIQDALRTYANTLGSALTNFVTTQGDQPKILSDVIENRTSPLAKERLFRLTEDYSTFADLLAAIQAPSPLAANHEKLIAGYKNIGIYLRAITTATTDNELYTTLLAYNEVAGTVATYHIAVTTSLKAFGVTFAPGEPGNAFMFDGATGGASFGL